MFIKIVALQILQKLLLQSNNRSKLLTNICKGYRIYVIWRNISVNTCTRVNSGIHNKLHFVLMMCIQIAAFLISTYAKTVGTASTRNYTLHIYLVIKIKG